MTAWEYKIENDITLDGCNTLGSHGWELVAVIGARNEDYKYTVKYFKRKLMELPDSNAK